MRHASVTTSWKSPHAGGDVRISPIGSRVAAVRPAWAQMKAHLGSLVGISLLQILAGVFDPPADLPAIPLALIGAMTLSILAALLAAIAIADRGLSRLRVVAELRER
jgi:hypothetical protein